MDEATWLACTDPRPMLEFLGDRAGVRKLRLFACACCRRIWHLLPDEGSRSAVATSERYADRLVRRKELEESRGGALANVVDSGTTPAAFAASSVARPQLAPAWVALLAQNAVASERNPSHGRDGERRAQADVLRDLFGNPFRPVALSRTWLNPAVISLAHAAYDNRTLPPGHLDPARLAVLADALAEAGCTDEAILTHCRSGGEHVRGCWLVDLLAGKG